MSSARRAYDLLRGYVNHGWDHLSHDEETQAEGELRKAIESPLPSTERAGSDSRGERIPEGPPITLDQARKLFDLPPNANSRQITAGYDSLRSAVDLSKFQEGSDAWQRARQVGRRLDAARNLLMENIDPTVRRFEKLEIE